MGFAKKIKRTLRGEQLKKKEGTPGIVLLSFRARGEQEFCILKKQLPVKDQELLVETAVEKRNDGEGSIDEPQTPAIGTSILLSTTTTSTSVETIATENPVSAVAEHQGQATTLEISVDDETDLLAQFQEEKKEISLERDVLKTELTKSKDLLQKNQLCFNILQSCYTSLKDTYELELYLHQEETREVSACFDILQSCYTSLKDTYELELYLHQEETRELNDCLGDQKLRVAQLENELEALKLSSIVITKDQESQTGIAKEISTADASTWTDETSDCPDILVVPEDCLQENQTEIAKEISTADASTGTDDTLDCPDILVVPEDCLDSSTDGNTEVIDSGVEEESSNSVVPAGQDESNTATTKGPVNDLPEMVSPEQLPIDQVIQALPEPNDEQTTVISDLTTISQFESIPSALEDVLEPQEVISSKLPEVITGAVSPSPTPDEDTAVSAPVEDESFKQMSSEEVRAAKKKAKKAKKNQDLAARRREKRRVAKLEKLSASTSLEEQSLDPSGTDGDLEIGDDNNPSESDSVPTTEKGLDSSETDGVLATEEDISNVLDTVELNTSDEAQTAPHPIYYINCDTPNVSDGQEVSRAEAAMVRGQYHQSQVNQSDYMDYLHLTNIPYSEPPEKIVAFFEDHIGPIKFFSMYLDKHGFKTGKASVLFCKPGDATRALLECHQSMEIGGRMVRIKLFVNGTRLQAEDFYSQRLSVKKLKDSDL